MRVTSHVFHYIPLVRSKFQVRFCQYSKYSNYAKVWNLESKDYYEAICMTIMIPNVRLPDTFKGPEL